MKKRISIFTLMIMLFTMFQNITLGATNLENANLIKGNRIETGVQFGGPYKWATVEANYIFYQGEEKSYPAYGINNRKKWSRASRRLSSRYYRKTTR